MSSCISNTEVFHDLIPLLKNLVKSERYLITLGGSHGKGVSDNLSDYDFRIYSDEYVQGDIWNIAAKELSNKVFDLKKNGIIVDDIWYRNIGETNEIIQQWVSGNGMPQSFIWCVWGYNMLTDIFNQIIIADPFNIATKWKEDLSVYPAKLKSALITKHTKSMKYWRNDYHFRNKVERADYVFLSSLTNKLIHDIFQVIYALNESYYPGDGNNMLLIKEFTILPKNFENRVYDILYPNNKEVNLFAQQFNKLVLLIDDVLVLCE